MNKLTFSAKALRGLDEVLEFISKDSPRAAEALVERIIRTCENGRIFPTEGCRRNTSEAVFGNTAWESTLSISETSAIARESN